MAGLCGKRRARARRMGAIGAVVGLAAFGAASAPVVPAGAEPGSQTFTSGTNDWQVPAGVFSVRVTANGEDGAGRATTRPGGGLYFGLGGGGATVRATISVTPGETLKVGVSEGGSAGGTNGGGNGSGGGGGGASWVKRGTTPLVVAGGGGGAGDSTFRDGVGGDGGNAPVGTDAGNGQPSPASAPAGTGGAGATTSANGTGGAGGVGTTSTGTTGSTGTSLAGGAGGAGSGSDGAGGGGGGGAGYFSGGGGGGGGVGTSFSSSYRGGGGGGGGGSSYADPGATSVEILGCCDGTHAGYVSLEYDINRTVNVTVVGGGQVTSTPSGIACPSTCSAPFPGDVTLNTQANTGWQFSGWSGDCTGSGACSLSPTADVNVTATFVEVPRDCNIEPKTAPPGFNLIRGTDGSDKLKGTSGNDLIFARGGKDLIEGGGGDDLLCGGAGKDSLSGGGGNDKLDGGADTDYFDGGGGRDLCVVKSGEISKDCESFTEPPA